MTKPETIRVLVADDHPVVCLGLSAMIGTQPDMAVVGQAATGKEAVEMFRSHSPDITLMDLRMPEMSGVEEIRVIRASASKAVSSSSPPIKAMMTSIKRSLPFSAVPAEGDAARRIAQGDSQRLRGAAATCRLR